MSPQGEKALIGRKAGRGRGGGRGWGGEASRVSFWRGKKTTKRRKRQKNTLLSFDYSCWHQLQLSTNNKLTQFFLINSNFAYRCSSGCCWRRQISEAAAIITWVIMISILKQFKPVFYTFSIHCYNLTFFNVFYIGLCFYVWQSHFAVKLMLKSFFQIQSLS